MRFKTELDYIQTLKRADFDPCTLSVNGYADQFVDVKEQFGSDLFSFFFNNTHSLDKGCIENFLALIWVTDNLKDALLFEEQLFNLCENSDMGVADSALTIFDHASCENDIEYDYTKLLNLNIKNKSLQDYAKSIAGIKE